MSPSLDLNRAREGIRTLLKRLSDGLPTGRFRFCLDGNLVPTEGTGGMFCSAFAARIAILTGIWQEWSKDMQDAVRDAIRSGQGEDGYVRDPWLLSHLSKSTEMFRQRVLRAETRQAAVILEGLNSSPTRQLPGRIQVPADIERVFSEEDWTQPWGAGSHFSHELTFFALNSKYFSPNQMLPEIQRATSKCLHRIFDRETGTWFAGTRNEEQAMNGAMKVLSGLYWIELNGASEELLQFALEQPIRTEGCGFFNRLFVLERTAFLAGSKDEQQRLQQLAIQSMKDLEQFEHPDGGYSMFHNRAQTVYYGAPVSTGEQCADLHGTMMAAWAISSSLRLLPEETLRTAEKWQMVMP